MNRTPPARTTGLWRKCAYAMIGVGCANAVARMKATSAEFRERIDRLESHEDGRKHA